MEPKTEIEKAHELIASEKKQRAELCLKELQESLTKNNCKASIINKMEGNTVISQLVIEAN